jgi:hypothetical protein
VKGCKTVVQELARTCSASSVKFCIIPLMPFNQTLWFSNRASELVADAPSHTSASPLSQAMASCKRTMRSCNASSPGSSHLRQVQRNRRLALEWRGGVLQKMANCAESA